MAAVFGGMGMRTIWITLRAVNYTERIFRAVITDLIKMKKVEEALGKARLRSLRIGNAMIMTGMMMASVGQMMMQSLWQLAMTTEKGAAEMQALQQELEATKIAFADTMYDILKTTGALDILHGVLSMIKGSKVLQWLILGVVAMGSMAVIAVGGLLLLAGAILSLTAIAGIKGPLLAYFVTQLQAIKIYSDLTAWSLVKLGVAASMAFGAFTVFMLIGEAIGPLAGAIVAAITAITVAYWALFVAQSAATWGIGLALGAGAAAVAMGIQAAHGFRGGTRSAPYTGPVMVHSGEVIYNPASRRPTQIANELEGEVVAGRRGATMVEMPITIENVNTEAKFSDLDEEFMRVWRKRMRRRR